MTIQELREKRAKAWDDAREFLDSKRNDSGLLSEEDSKTYDATVKTLRKLKDNTGNYIWNPSVQAGVPDMILNRPYYTSSYVPTLEAGSKAIAFGDFKYYWIGDRQGRTFKRLNEVFAMNGQVGFIASQRVDGRLILPEAVKTLTIKGTSTTKA